ncbi:hypothetical protein [Duganella callida]|uniref:hypothetical protein n=1 Tax=Duganella callida TaxID=2561932 RepID=UPI00197A734D|nr:hypothetical protein [Duganella callida]
MLKWFADQRGAYFFLLLGIALVLVFALLEYRLPRAAELETARGRVVWQRETRAAIYFTLADQQRFVLYTKGDPDNRQRAVVRDAEMYPLAVRFLRRQSVAAGYAPGPFYAVYGVAVGGKEVASFAQVRAAWQRDNLVALVLGLLFAAAGAYRLRLLGTSLSRADGGTPASRRSR